MKRLPQLLLLVLTLGYSESAWAQTCTEVATAGTDGTAQTSLTTGTFAATAGATIIVFTRDGSTGDISSVADDPTPTNTYTSLVNTTEVNGPAIRAWKSENITGVATDAVKVTWMSSSTYRWVDVIQCTGAAASSVDAFGGKDAAAATDLVTNSITTAQADEVLLVAAGQTTFATYSAGSGFTLINGTLGAEGLNFGGSEKQTFSSTQSGITAHITSDTSAGYQTAWVSIKKAASATSHKNCTLLGVC